MDVFQQECERKMNSKWSERPKKQFWQNKDQTLLLFKQYNYVHLQLNSTYITYTQGGIFLIFETC